MVDSVTIARTYFEALLRRAEFYAPGQAAVQNDERQKHVTISKAEHEHLLRATREYSILKSALFRGGLSPATLETLIRGGEDVNDEDAEGRASFDAYDGLFTRPTTVPTTLSKPNVDHSTAGVSQEMAPNRDLSRSRDAFNRPESFEHATAPFESAPDKGNCYVPQLADATCQKAANSKNGQRTILLSNLSHRTTHKDLVSVVRGGKLLDIHLRNDRTATVSFVDGAHEFLAFAKRNDIYIHQKRVDVRWNDRQFYVPSHVANKIANGATRNFVIRAAADKLTEAGIREDMEHIHNLVIIDVKLKKGDIYVSTNSIHNALFARTCMLSRSGYKGMRIEWVPDECAGPFPHVELSVRKSHVPALQARKVELLANRFGCLNTDGTEDGSDDEGYDDDNDDKENRTNGLVHDGISLS